MFSFNYQGISSTNKCEAVERPAIPTPRRRIEAITVPGRNGSLHLSDDTFEEVVIAINLNFKANSENEFGAKSAEIKSWLVGYNSPESILTFSDMPNEFYKVNYVELGEISRDNKVVGRVTATFYCDPFIYTDEGEEEKTISTSTYFPTQYPCEPIYTLTVTSDNAELKLQRKPSVKIIGASGRTVTIDTALNIAYDEDEEYVLLDGDISDLRFSNGVVKFETISGVFGVVKPRWRHL